MARMLRPVALLARHMGDVGNTGHPIPEAAIPRPDSSRPGAVVCVPPF